MEGNVRCVDFRICGAGNVGLPLAVVGRSEAEPPNEDNCKTQCGSKQPLQRTMEANQQGRQYG